MSYGPELNCSGMAAVYADVWPGDKAHTDGQGLPQSSWSCRIVSPVHQQTSHPLNCITPMFEFRVPERCDDMLFYWYHSFAWESSHLPSKAAGPQNELQLHCLLDASICISASLFLKNACQKHFIKTLLFSNCLLMLSLLLLSILIRISV